MVRVAGGRGTFDGPVDGKPEQKEPGQVLRTPRTKGQFHPARGPECRICFSSLHRASVPGGCYEC